VIQQIIASPKRRALKDKCALLLRAGQVEDAFRQLSGMAEIHDPEVYSMLAEVHRHLGNEAEWMKYAFTSGEWEEHEERALSSGSRSMPKAGVFRSSRAEYPPLSGGVTLAHSIQNEFAI
jgi:predicted Zn-dependent protease